jgi:hypothetical protein
LTEIEKEVKKRYQKLFLIQSSLLSLEIGGIYMEKQVKTYVQTSLF